MPCPAALRDVVLDLSHHNPVDSFWEIKRSGVEAVFLKATQGTGFTSPKYADYLRRARETRLLAGAYHFGTGATAEKQVEHFLAKTAPLGSALLCLDWETNHTKGETTMTLEGAETFVELVHAKTGRWPVLYSNQAFLLERLARKVTPLSNCPLWIARFVDDYAKTSPRLAAAFKSWSFWQYTEKGSSPGVRGNVDRNVTRMTSAELQDFWANAGR